MTTTAKTTAKTVPNKPTEQMRREAAHPRYSDPRHPEFDLRKLPPTVRAVGERVFDFVEPTARDLHALLDMATQRAQANRDAQSFGVNLADSMGLEYQMTNDELGAVIATAQAATQGLEIWCERMTQVLKTRAEAVAHHAAEESKTATQN